MKEITIEKYNKIMSGIIGKKLAIDETMIALLDEAGKYTIKQSSRNGKTDKSSLSRRRKRKHLIINSDIKKGKK